MVIISLPGISTCVVRGSLTETGPDPYRLQLFPLKLNLHSALDVFLPLLFIIAFVVVVVGGRGGAVVVVLFLVLVLLLLWTKEGCGSMC